MTDSTLRREDDKAVARLEVGFDNLKEQLGEVKESVKTVDTKLDALLDMTTLLGKISEKQLNLELADTHLKEAIVKADTRFQSFREKEFEPIKEFKTKWETGLRVWLFVFVFAQVTIGWFIKDKVEYINKAAQKIDKMAQRIEYLEKRVK